MITRSIRKIYIHCSATPPDMEVYAKDIDRWHKANGWSGIGYHDVIPRNGMVEKGRPLHKAGAHVKGHNKDSIGICLVGGVTADMIPISNYTPAQWKALRGLLVEYLERFPKATIHGHNEADPSKACPCFDVQQWLHEKPLVFNSPKIVQPEKLTFCEQLVKMFKQFF